MSDIFVFSSVAHGDPFKESGETVEAVETPEGFCAILGCWRIGEWLQIGISLNHSEENDGSAMWITNLYVRYVDDKIVETSNVAPEFLKGRRRKFVTHPLDARTVK